jgi:hypothetical protein
MFPTTPTEAEFMQTVQGVPACVAAVFLLSQIVSGAGNGDEVTRLAVRGRRAAEFQVRRYIRFGANHDPAARLHPPHSSILVLQSASTGRPAGQHATIYAAKDTAASIHSFEGKRDPGGRRGGTPRQLNDATAALFVVAVLMLAYVVHGVPTRWHLFPHA